MKQEKIKKNNKRDDGQGTIIQRTNGTYQIKLRDGKKADGKPKYKYFSGKTQAECKRKLREYQQQQALLKDSYTDMTFNEYADFYMYNVKYGTVKPSYFDRIEKTIRCHIKPDIGYIKMNDVSTQHLQLLINERAFPTDGKKPLARSSVKKIQEALNMIFSYAVLREHIKKNPVEGVVLPAEVNMLVKTKDMEEIQEDEIKRIVSVCNTRIKDGSRIKYRLGPLYIFLLNTGLRIGEALALEKNDIDFEKRVVQVTKSLATVKERDENKKALGNKIVISPPKTKRSIRKVPLNNTAIDALQSMIENNEKLGIKSPYIFCSNEGTLVNERNAMRAFDVILKQAEVKHYGLHALRHTFASRLLRKTQGRVEIVSEILGHSNTSITYNRYVHVLENDKFEAVSALNSI